MKDLKFKKPAKYLSINLLFIIIVRILFISIVFFFLMHEVSKNITEFQAYYDNISFSYYLLFLVSLDRYLQYSSKKLSNPELFTGNSLYKLIKYLKWFLLVITVVLLVLTIKIMPIEWPNLIDQKILYILTKIFPNLFGANISYIIITMLVFYAATVANFNKQLREEQDLTI
jgi:hypothetical protein